MTRRPPRFAEWLLARMLGDADRDAIIGDLEEQYRQRGGAAGVWYWGQVWSCLGPTMRRRRLARNLERRDSMFEDLRRDIRFGARQLLVRPGFTAAALVTLILGIGANTAIFSVVHGVVLRPLGYRAPDRIVSVWPTLWFSKGLFDRLRESVHTFSSVAVYSGNGYVLTGLGTSEFLEGPRVSADFFRVLGIEAQLGRTFEPGDDRPGAEPVAVISHGMWNRAFGASPDVLDRTLDLDGVAYRIVGVMPAGFDFLQAGADVSVPLILNPETSDYSSARYLHGIGRLGDGVTVTQAGADVQMAAERWQQEFGWSDARIRSATVTPLREVLVREVRTPMYLLLGAVGLMLLVACANVANLLIARGLGRRKEVAVRRALGASRGRVVRQLVTEGALLGVLGGLGGVLFAIGTVPLLRTLLPEDTPRLESIAVDGSVLALAGGLSVVSCLLFALVPAFQAAGGDLRSALPTGGTSAALDRRGARLRQSLVFSETVMAAVLLIGAGLLARSLWHLQHVELGFDPGDKVGFHLVLREADYGSGGGAYQVHERVSERLATVPGVAASGVIHSAPVIGGGWNTGVVLESASDSENPPFSFWRVATPSYFEAMGIPLIRGRYVVDADRLGALGVALVNQTAAEAWWPDEDPIGRRIRLTFEPSDEWVTVIGVVADVRILGAGVRAPPTVYRPLGQAFPALAQVGTISMWHMVRTAVPDLAIVSGAIRERVREVDPHAVVVQLAPLRGSIGQTLAEARSTMVLLLAFAMSSLTLGAIGLYGLVAYRVGERTREIGLRMAMGAAGPHIIRLVVREGAGLAAAGVTVGLIVALGAGRAVRSLLFEVEPHDPAVFAVVALVLIAVALVASYLPARRAAGIDPVRALRAD